MSRGGFNTFRATKSRSEHQTQTSKPSASVTTDSEDGSAKFEFITEKGDSTRKSADERKTIRKRAMYETAKSIRRSGTRPAHAPSLQIPLEIPPSFRWYQPEARAFSKAPDAMSDSSLRLTGQTEPSHVAPSRELLIGPRQPVDEEQQMSPRIDLGSGGFVDRFGGGRRNLLFNFPIEMNTRKHELLDHVFNDELCKGSWTEAWQTTSSDSAVVYQLLYWSVLHIRWLRDPENKEEPHEALVYYANAVRIINSRVRDANEAASDVTIRLVTMLLFYNYSIGSIKNWQTHIAGLKQMINLRGGLAGLNSNPSLKYTLARIDIGGSCLQDAPPSFPLPEGLSGLQDLELGSTLSPDSWEWTSVFTSNDKLSSIINHLRRVSALVDANISLLPLPLRLPQSALNYRYVGPLLHMFLMAQNNILENDVLYARHEAFRLAGILYLAEVRRSLGVFPVWSKAQIEKLETLFLERRNELNWEGPVNPRLLIPKLWVVTFAAIEAATDEQRRLFEYEMRNTAERIGIQSYEHLEDALKTFFYIEMVHSTKLKALYISAIESRVAP